jgi:hypothetical protein
MFAWLFISDYEIKVYFFSLAVGVAGFLTLATLFSVGKPRSRWRAHRRRSPGLICAGRREWARCISQWPVRELPRPWCPGMPLFDMRGFPPNHG